MSLTDQIDADMASLTEEIEAKKHQAAELLEKSLKDALSGHSPAAKGQPPGRKSGTLQASIKSEVTADGLTVYTDCPYAGYVQKHHPFFDSTVEETRSAVDRILEL